MQTRRSLKGAVAAVLAGCLLTAAPARGQDPAPPPASQPATPPDANAVTAPDQPPPDQKPPVAEPVELRPVSETGRTNFKSLIHDTAYDFKHFVSDVEPLLWIAGGGGAALALHPLDDNVNDRFRSGGAIHTFYKPGVVIGYGAVQIGAALGTWVIGRGIDKEGRAAHIGLDLLRAQIVTQTFTYGLKYAVGRDRPDGSKYSFPSGHASTTFATASVLERHFGWRAGIPTYVLAAYVASSRLHENRHYLSDVIFGGALGLAAGRTVTRHGRHNFAMVPLFVPGGGYGIALVRLG